MNFCFDRPPHGQVDPRQLTSGQLAALRLLDSHYCTRVKGGWRGAGTKLITLPTAQRLGALRLVMRRDYNGRPRLEVTGTGKNTLAVADQRSTRRQA